MNEVSDPLATILTANPAYLATSAQAWDAVNNRFTDLSGNGRHGELTGGTVTVGSVTGNGAGWSIPYVGGTTSTLISWPAVSIPPTFTICSITRYTGGQSQRILTCEAPTNWLHGHLTGNAGAVFYTGSTALLSYSISTRTNWVIACGRNTATAGAAGVIVNGVVTANAFGGSGNCRLTMHGWDTSQRSDWQLSRLYVWNTHLSNTVFAEASARLNSFVLTNPDTGQCTACVAGKYKITGSSACIDCGVGTYSTSTGATISTTCVTCPTSSSSPLASSAVAACTCNSGFTGPHGGSCTACVAGKYKTSTGSVACTDCLAGTYSTSTGATLAATCLLCPINTFSGASSSSCQQCQANALSVAGSASQEFCYCKSGYAHVEGSYTCRICDPGTWNSQLGRTACSKCSVGLFSVHYGAVGVETCLSCPLGQWSPEGSPNCNLCPVNSRAGASSGAITNCACDAGFSGPNGGTCSACTTGQYKNASGTSACVNCVGGMYSNATGASMCTSCPTGLYSRNGVNCTIDNVGVYLVKMSVSLPMSRQEFNGSAQITFKRSVALAAGVSSTVVRIDRILDMDGGVARRRLLATGIGVDTSVQAASESVASAISTSLTAETLNSALTAAGLPPATILQAPAFGGPLSYVNCSACPAGTAFADGVCPACAGDTTSVVGGVGCECKAGFTGVGTSCQECPAGTYKRMSGSSACRSCQSNSWSEEASALCACNAGYTGNTGDVCVACVSGKYKNMTGPAACSDCAGNRNSGAGAPNVTTCICNAGYTQVENAAVSYDVVYAQACVGCEFGKFKGLTGVQACTTCAQNQSAVIASTICSCVAGFTGPDGGPCAECAQGKYKNWLGSQPCTTCPVNTDTAAIGSALLVNCTCNRGYTGPDGTACVACAGGTYKNFTGAAPCSTCPERTMSSIGSASIERCQCMPSFSGPDGGPCGQCESGKYKNWPNSSCAPCSVNSDSTEGSTLCKCTTGNTEVLGYTGITTSNGNQYDLLQACGVSEKERCPSLGCGTNAPVYHPSSTNLFNDQIYDGNLGGIPVSWDCRPGGWTVSALPIDFGREKIVTSVVVYFELGWCGNHFCGPLYTVRVGNTPPGWSPDTNNELLCPPSTPSYSSSPRIYANGFTFVKFTIDCGNTLRGRYFTINKQNVQWSSATMSPHEMQVMGFKEYMTCSSCAAGKYKNGTGTAACTTCPANSYEPDVGATLETNCSCNVGYEGADGGPCLACPLGKYKDTNGTAPCVSCPVDTYIDVQASAYCKACPEFKTSPSGSAFVTECQCKQGYGGYTTTGVNLARSCGADGASPCATTAWSGSGSFANDNVILSYVNGVAQFNGVYTENPVWMYVDFGKVMEVRDFAMHVYGDPSYPYMHRFWVFASNTTTPNGVNPALPFRWGAPWDDTGIIQDGSAQFCARDVRRISGTSTFGTCAPADFYVSPKVNWYDSYTSINRCTCGAPVFGRYLMVWNFYINPNYLTIIEWQIFGRPSISCAACQPGKYKDNIGSALCTSCPLGQYSAELSATSNDTCSTCPENTYNDRAGAVCYACPRFAVSPTGSPSIWNCQCIPGYTGPGGSGYFINNMARACGLNSNDACLSAGFSLLVSGNAGMSAAVDLSYSTGGAWRYVSGMSGAFAGINFGVERDVTTVSVYQGAANLKLYVGNLYSPYTSNAPCSSVSTWESPWRLYTCGKRGQYLYFEQPDTALNLELTEISVSGYVVGDACTACGSGRYKASVGPSDCTACDVNTYSEVVNATSVATCLTCQGNSTSVQASPSKLFCQCNVGFLHDGEECEMCSPGTYNSQLGRTACSKCSMGLYSVNYQATDNETCLSCPAGQWSPEGSSVCMMCPENSAAPPGMGRIVDCACNVGYTGPGGGPCAQCEVGKYKNFTGSWPCVMCPAYTSSPLASVNLGDCFCIAGFSGANGLPCTACGIGKYKAVSGTSSCQLCPVNTYSDSVGFSVCTACVSSSAAVSGSTSIWNCTCNAGYTGPTYTGVQRNTNFARSCGDGSQACPTLQSSTFVDETADMAVDGTTLTRSNTMFASNQWWRVDFGRRVTIVSVLIFFSQHTSDTLVVHVGDDEAAGANSICSSVNFYGTADDWKTVNCSVARTGRYLHVRNTVGGVLGLREIQPIGSEVVPILWPGFCEACKPGFFKNSTGNQVCSPCSANTFSNVTAARSAQTCLPCVSNMMSAAGSVSCDCDVGFTAEAGVCVSCAFGKFKSAVGSEACTPCPVRSIALSNSRETCACEEGYEATWLNS